MLHYWYPFFAFFFIALFTFISVPTIAITIIVAIDLKGKKRVNYIWGDIEKKPSTKVQKQIQKKERRQIRSRKFCYRKVRRAVSIYSDR